MPQARRLVAPLLLGMLLAACLTACRGEAAAGSDDDPAQVDAVEAPELGACRTLAPQDVAEPSNATATVPARSRTPRRPTPSGQLPASFDEADRDDHGLGAWAYDTCSRKL